MRFLAFAAVLPLLAGCVAGDAGELLFDDRLVVPVGSVGYVTVSLDANETATWTWSSDRPIAFDGLLLCDEETTKAAPLATSGQGTFTATAHGCLADLVWLHASNTVLVRVKVTGDGELFEHGVAEETQNAHADNGT